MLDPHCQGTYTSTWKVQVVLHNINNLGPSSSVSLMLLTFKLLPLTRLSRSDDVAALQLDRCQYMPG